MNAETLPLGGFSLRLCPAAGMATNGILGTFETLALQKVVNARHAQTAATGQCFILRQQGIELFLKRPEPWQGLNRALVIKSALW